MYGWNPLYKSSKRYLLSENYSKLCGFTVSFVVLLLFLVLALPGIAS